MRPSALVLALLVAAVVLFVPRPGMAQAQSGTLLLVTGQISPALSAEGEIGSARRVEFAVVGETVNLASRLEMLTRRLGSAAVVSGALIEAASEGVQSEGASLELFVSIEPQIVEGYGTPVAVSILDPKKLDSRLRAAAGDGDLVEG